MAMQQFDDPQQLGTTPAGPVHRFKCVDCSYGASRRMAPERCPMCGSSVWEHETWRPFSAFVEDVTAAPEIRAH
jgi:rubrerythrin